MRGSLRVNGIPKPRPDDGSTASGVPWFVRLKTSNASPTRPGATGTLTVGSIRRSTFQIGSFTRRPRGSRRTVWKLPGTSVLK